MRYDGWVERPNEWTRKNCLCAHHRYGTKNIWRTKSGTDIPFSEMKHSEIYKSLTFLKRRYRYKNLTQCCLTYMFERIMALEKEFNKRMKLKGG